MANQNLKIVIGAVDKTKAAFASVAKSLSVVRKALFNFKTGIAAAFGAGGLGLLVKSSMQSIDVLGKTASKIGVTTGELQKLRYAADLAGVETRTVDMALQRFTRRLSEAANNTGEAKDALKELGINAQSFQELALEDQMLKLADAFARVGSDGDQVRLAFKLFDSEGVAMINVLKEGSDALKNMFDDAESLGFVLSATAVKGVEDANDQFTRLTALLRGVRDQIVAALSPALGKLAKDITDLISKSIGSADKIEDFSKKLAINILEFMKNATSGIITFFNNVINSINNVGQELHDLSRMFSLSIDEKQFNAKLDKMQEQLQFFADIAESNGEKSKASFEKVLKATEPLRSGVRLTRDEYLAMRKAIMQLAREDSRLSGSVFMLEKNLFALANSADNVEKGFQGLGKITLDTQFIFDEYIKAVEGGKETTDDMTESVKACTGAIVDLDDVFEPATNGLKDYAQQAKLVKQNLRTAALNGVKSLEDALVGVVDGTMKAKDAFKQMAKSIISDLIRIQIQRSITAPLANALDALLPSGEAVLKPKAMGGSVAANRPYIVGERGAELFVPNGSGTIIPNNKVSGGGGTVVNQTINVHAGVAQTVRAEIMSMMPQIAETTKAAVVDARRRGGSFAAAF